MECTIVAYRSSRSGSIDRDEFVGLHRELQATGLTRYDVQKCMEDLDADANGSIQFNELILWLDRH
jgi:Ca2+-binding EF-hand superfamily protein